MEPSEQVNLPMWQARLRSVQVSDPVADYVVRLVTGTRTHSALSLGAFRSAVGVSLVRLVTPFGTVSADWAVPLFARPFDRATGRFHLSIALRN